MGLGGPCSVLCLAWWGLFPDSMGKLNLHKRAAFVLAREGAPCTYQRRVRCSRGVPTVPRAVPSLPLHGHGHGHAPPC